MKEKKAQIIVTQWEDDSTTVQYEGVSSRTDIRFLLHAVEKDVRRRKSAGISFSEKSPLAWASANNGSSTETDAKKEVLDATS